jgi:hypothetical protein
VTLPRSGRYTPQQKNHPPPPDPVPLVGGEGQVIVIALQGMSALEKQHSLAAVWSVTGTGWAGKPCTCGGSGYVGLTAGSGQHTEALADQQIRIL